MSDLLRVYKGGALVGVLDKGDGEPFYGFTYDEAYLKMSSAMPLSLSLPLSARRYTGHEAMPFFEGLLPEGDVREAVARQFHVSALRPMELIRVLGKDCAGDVVVLGEDDGCDLPEEAAYVPPLNALEEIARYPYGAISQLRAEYRLSLAGGQEKIALFHDDRAPLAEGWFAPLAGAPSSHIIKPQVTDRFPFLALNEFMCMEAARALGLDVPDAAIVPGEHPPLFSLSAVTIAKARRNPATARPRCCGGCTRRTFAKLSAALRERSTRHEKPITLRIWPPFWWAMLHDPLRRSANCSGGSP